MNKQDIKQAVISVLVGATISFLTVLLQGLLNILQHVPPEIIGSAAGVGRQMLVWAHTRHA